MEVAGTSFLVMAGHQGAARDRLPSAAPEGRVACCDVVVMENLYGAGDMAGYDSYEGSRRAHPWPRTRPDDWERAMDISSHLARSPAGHHRRVPILGPLIVAVADRHAAVLVHDDVVHERSAAIAGQRLLGIRERGETSA